MDYELVNEFPEPISVKGEGPFISLYQPTHRYTPENKKDPVVFANLIREIENALLKEFKKTEVSDLLEPFYKMETDKTIWNNTLDGLAVLANSEKCVVYRLQRPMPELAVVGSSYHLKPLIRYYQSADKYQLLGLSRTFFKLYEGSRDGFAEIEIDPKVPRTFKDVVGTEHTERYVSHSSSGDRGGHAMFYGHGGKKVDLDVDTEKYFRYVDKFVFDHYSNVDKYPLILIALVEHHPMFRKISDNPHLLEKGIEGSCEHMEMDQIRMKAWEIIEPLLLEKTKKLVESFTMAKAKSVGSDDPEEVAMAALGNRVRAVLIDADKIISGHIDHNTGIVEYGDVGYLYHNDILDDIAEIVYRNHGEVVVLPTEKMPSDTGISAIYR